MSDGKKIEFTYGNAKARFNQETHKLEFEGDDDSKLRNGIIGIFNAIKKIGGDPKKIDQGLETDLLNNLQSIFDAGKTTAIDDDEMAWALGFQRGDDVKKYINDKLKDIESKKAKPAPTVVLDNSPITLTIREDWSDYQSEDLEGDNEGISECYYEEEIPSEEGGESTTKRVVVGYSTNIDGVSVLAKTLEEIKTIKEQMQAEYDKIKGIPEGEETDEAMAARMANNMEAIEKMAKLANYDKATVLMLLDYFVTTNDDTYLDFVSPEFTSFVCRLMDTKNFDVIDKLRDGLVEDNKFYGSETAFVKYASLYKEVRDKELRGEKLNDNEKAIRDKLKDDVVWTTCDSLVCFDGQGNIRYRDDKNVFKDARIGEHVAGATRETVENFTRDYNEALEAIEKAPDDKKEAVKAEKYKELYHKYAEVKDEDSFACSVLTSGLMGYADLEDIKTAINTNGAEFLSYLCNYGIDVNDDIANQVNLSIVERAVEIYTKDDKGNPFNMAFLYNIMYKVDYTTFSEDSEENGKIAQGIKDKLLESYFEVKEIPAPVVEKTENVSEGESEDGESSETVSGEEENAAPTKEYKYTGRRLTASEAETFIDVLGDYGNKDMKLALLNALKPEDIATDEWGVEIVKSLTDKESADDENLLLAHYAKLVDEGMGVNDLLKLIENIAKIDSERKDNTSIPYDVIIGSEIYDDNEEKLSAELLKYCSKQAVISDANRMELIRHYIKAEDDGTVVDTELLESAGLTLSNLIKTLPNGIELVNVGEPTEEVVKRTNVLNAILDKMTMSYSEEDWMTLYGSFNSETVGAKEKFSKRFLEILTDDLSVDNIKKASQLLDKMGIGRAELKALGKDFVDRAVSSNFDVNKLLELIKFCGKCGFDQSKVMAEIDITTLTPEDKKEVRNSMFANYLNGAKLNEGDSIDKFIENGWVEKIPKLTSFRRNKTNAWGAGLYRIGDYQFEIENGVYRQRSQKGTQDGLDLYASIKGANSPWGWGHEKAKDILGKIDKNSVVDTILTFNGFGEDGIMRFLESEWYNIKVEDMLKIPLALVAWGKENGKDTSELEELINQSQDRLQKGSFAGGVAKQIDEAMVRLIGS